MNVTFMPEEVFGSVELQPFAEKPKENEKPQNSYGGKRKKEKFVYLDNCLDPNESKNGIRLNNLSENPFREGCND